MADYGDLFKIDDSDVFIAEGPLEEGGLWCTFYHYMDKDGNEYQIWVDQNGEEKVVEL